MSDQFDRQQLFSQAFQETNAGGISLLQKLTYTTTRSQSTTRAKKLTILLVGSNGNGKSTLGNFLINPVCAIEQQKKPTFKTGGDGKPCTQRVEQRETSYYSEKYAEHFVFNFMDTPGLNESSEKDFEHMIEIVTEAKKAQSIAACVFVVKFNSQIDDQYKKTIQYYRNLLKFVFEKNVFIVMTDYATDERSVQMRRARNIIDDDVVVNNKLEIVHQVALSYSDVLVFKLDCLPFDTRELETSLEERKSILDYVASLDPIAVPDNLGVAKTDYIERSDAEETKLLEGEINGYKERLGECGEKQREVLNKIHNERQSLTQCQIKIRNLKAQLKEYDSSELVTADSWSINSEWKFFQSQRASYQLSSEWKIDKNAIKKWTNGKCRFVDEEITEKSLRGNIQGQFMRGLYANIVLQVQKCVKYEKKIHDCNKSLQEKEEEKELIKNSIKLLTEENKQYTEMIEYFERYIKDRNSRIKELSKDYMTVDEANERIKTLSS